MTHAGPKKELRVVDRNGNSEVVKAAFLHDTELKLNSCIVFREKPQLLRKGGDDKLAAAPPGAQKQG